MMTRQDLNRLFKKVSSECYINGKAQPVTIRPEEVMNLRLAVMVENASEFFETDDGFLTLHEKLLDDAIALAVEMKGVGRQDVIWNPDMDALQKFENYVSDCLNLQLADIVNQGYI